MENQPPRTPDTRTAPQIPRAPLRPDRIWSVIKINDSALQYHRHLQKNQAI